MLVARVARVAGLRVPDERVVLARFTFLGVGILQVEIGQLVATLIERLVCERAGLIERQRRSRRVLVELVPVPEYPAGRSIDGDAVFLFFEGSKITDFPQQQPRCLPIDLVGLPDGPALQEVADSERIDVLLQPRNMMVVADRDVALPEEFV